MEENENIIKFEKPEEIEKVGVEIEDLTYRIEEMENSMSESLKNLQNVMAQQKKLIELVESANDEEFKQFIEDSKQQLDALQKQEVELICMTDIVKQVIERCKADSEQSKTISMFCTALKIFR